MSVFEEVLVDVEERGRRRRESPSGPGLPFLEALASVPPHPCVTTARAEAAYRLLQSSGPAAGLQPRTAAREDAAGPTPESGLSRNRLRALRRSAAWRLHPDRGPAEGPRAAQALARINAAIDAALEQCRD